MPLFSVLSLLGTFLCLAGIYLLTGFPFLAATQLLVYVGAIMVLFLFVIMLLNLGEAAELERHAGMSLSRAASVRRRDVGGAARPRGPRRGQRGFGLLGGQPAAGARARRPPDLARLLFSRYMLPFEAASLLLLATMVAVNRGSRSASASARP